MPLVAKGAPAPSGRSLTEAAVATIRDRILDLSLESGSRIDERLLMDRFRLSRTPAREALNRLVAEGLVAIQAKKGTFVRSLDVGQMKEFFDAYLVGERLMGFYCRFDDRALVGDLRTLERAYKAAVKGRRYRDITRRNAELHLRVARATSNEYVRDFCGRLHNHARRLSYFIYQMESADVSYCELQQEHVARENGQIIDAIAARDRDALVALLGRHALRFQERIARFVSDRRGATFPLQP